MTKAKKTKGTMRAIDDLLKSLMKSKDKEDLEDEDVMDEEPVDEPTVAMDEGEEEAPEDMDESMDEEEVDEPEEEEATEDVEKSEEDEEEVEDDEAQTMELDEVVEAVTNRILPDIKEYLEELMENQKEAMDATKNDMDELAGAVEKSLGILDDLMNKKEETGMIKSLTSKVDQMEKRLEERKSLTRRNDPKLQERFEKSIKVEDLSKSQKAAILSSHYQAGHKGILTTDITNAEIGGPLSEAALDVLEKAIQ